MTYVKTKLKSSIKIDAIITLHYFEYMKDFEFKGEAHDFWEFLYVDKGTVSVCSDQTWLTLTTGDIIFHQPNEFHAIKSIGKNSPNLIAISFTSSSKAMEFFIHKKFTLTHHERELVSRMILEAGHTFSTPLHIPSIEQVKLRSSTPFASQQLIRLYLELFLITSRRNHSDTAIEHIAIPRESPERKASRQERLDAILQFMSFHLCGQLKVRDICNAFAISRSSLQALFHSQLGVGVMEHFNKMKIECAKDIIRDGTMNFTEITYYLSYSSLSYFSKQFKNATGMSPSEYSSSVKGISEKLRHSETPQNLTPSSKVR